MKIHTMLVGLLVAFTAAPALASEPVPYPQDYREWYHVKSMVISPGHPLAQPFAGLHHIYANGAAREGLKSGRFPTGAVLVFDLLEAVQAEHAIEEGKRKLIGVMVKDPQRYGATGGWGFEGFGEGRVDVRLTKDGGRSCFQCHRQARDRDYVFSRLRD